MFKKFILNNNDESVENFEFKKFGLKISKSAQNYEKTILKEIKPFKLNNNASTKSGVSYLKEKRIKDFIDSEVDRKLEEEKKTIFEEFKQKGFEAGKEEGLKLDQEKIIEAYKDQVDENSKALAELINSVENFKKKLVAQTENDILDLVKLYCEKICLREIEIDENHLKKIVQSIFEEYTNIQEIKFKISDQDFEKFKFIESELRSDGILINFNTDTNIKSGDLVIETKNGEINLSVEERFKRVWSSLKK